MRKLLLSLVLLFCALEIAHAQQISGLSFSIKASQYPSVGAQYGITPGLSARATAHFAHLLDGFILTGALLGRVHQEEALSAWVGASVSFSRQVPIWADNLTFFPSAIATVSYKLNDRAAVFADLVLSTYIEGDGIAPYEDIAMFDTGIGLSFKL